MRRSALSVLAIVFCAVADSAMAGGYYGQPLLETGFPLSGGTLNGAITFDTTARCIQWTTTGTKLCYGGADGKLQVVNSGGTNTTGNGIQFGDNSSSSCLLRWNATSTMALRTGADGANCALGVGNIDGTGYLASGSFVQLASKARLQANAIDGIVDVQSSGGTAFGTLSLVQLGTIASANLNITTKQNLYTVPSGRSAVVAFGVVHDPSAAVTTAICGFGRDANASDMITAVVLSSLTGTTIYKRMDPAASPVKAAAADVIGFRCSTAEGSARTATVDVFGYLY